MVVLLEHRDVMAHERQVVCCRKAARAAADDGDALAGGRRLRRGGHESRRQHRVLFDGADVDGRIDHAATAGGFARMLAHECAGARERIVVADDAHGIRIAPGAHQVDVGRDVDMRGAALDAGHRCETLLADAALEVRFSIFLDEVGEGETDPSGLKADRAVGCRVEGLAGVHQAIDDAFAPFAFEDVFQIVGQPAEPDAAGRALAAALRCAEAEEACGGLYRAVGVA